MLIAYFNYVAMRNRPPSELAQPLSYLYHHHLAAPQWRPRALPAHYVDMLLPADDVEPRAAWAALPPLLKGYLRLGAMTGDGEVIDAQFNTIDVCGVLPTERLTARYVRRYRATSNARKVA